jgi:predicted transcriptional regulator
MKNVKQQVYKKKKYEADVSSSIETIEIIAARGGLDDVLREVKKLKIKF